MNLKELKKEAKELLESYEAEDGRYYNPTEHGLNQIFETWMENKKGILKAFEKHPNYNGRGQIVLTEEFAREIDKVSFEESLDKLIRMIDVEHKAERELLISVPAETFVNEEFAEKVNASMVTRASKGKKTSRVIRAICVSAGISKKEEFERTYAKLSDAINPLKVTRYTILSVNPLDYWTMSFGNSWTSCHTIDKTGLRNCDDGYSGCYSGGTESYMLDPSSIVVYTVDKNDDVSQPELCDKVTRCMFHIGESKIVQGRLYPQGNDDNSDAYKQIREIVQRVIAQIWEVPNLWSNTKGAETCTEYTESFGVHYRDYEKFDTCNVSILKNIEEKQKWKLIRIGHDPICPECGCEHEGDECILCPECSNTKYCKCCGSVIHNDDDDRVYIDDDEIYCCSSCAERAGYVFCIDEEWHWLEDCEYDHYNNEYFLPNSDTVYTEDGHTYFSAENAEADGYRFVWHYDAWYHENVLYYCGKCYEYFLADDYNFEKNCCTGCLESEEEEDE